MKRVSVAWLGWVAFLWGCAESARGDQTPASEDVAGDLGDALEDTGPPPTFDVVPRDGGGEAATDADDAAACASSETCGNGLDDNCDGQADEGCACIPGSMQRCFAGPARAAGVGACAYGAQRCEGSGQEFGTWGACAGARGPTGERCDGVDDDCDGVVDNGCACRVDDRRGCYTGPPATRAIGTCRDGAQVCAAGPGGIGSGWSACAGETLPTSDACDGVDNDCNGTVDDGCACRPAETRRCYGGPAGTAGVGRCRAGTQTCAATGATPAWGTCAGQELPAPERCDGVDDDCDGVVDNGCACRPGEARPCYSGATATRGVGLCAPGTQTCAAGPMGVGSAWGACLGERLPAAETCDDADNNCDGAVDEVCACRPSETRVCYAGPVGTAGVGPCRAGSQTCVAGPTGVGSAWGACGAQTLPTGELCDGIDNDCDGVVDDGCACRAGETRPCYGGPAGTAGVGVCRAGSQGCVITAGVAAWGACAGQTVPGAEACNLVDDNCDGRIDEGCACTAGLTRACYGGPAGTAGVGVCRAGSQTCAAGAGGVGSAWGACAGQVLPGAEVCDRTDNDCNGVVDDGCACAVGATQACYAGPPGTAGVGACRAGSQTCAAGAGGVGSAWGACAGQVLPTGETCNSTDDNCDGMVDNGVPCAGPMARCPAPVSAPAGTVIVLAGSATGAVSYRWEVVATPPGGAAVLGSPSAASTAFLAYIVGDYTVRFTVTDAAGRTATCTTMVSMLAHGLRVELNWDTGIRTADPASTLRTDLDLHVHNRTAPAWFNDPDDCFYGNRTPRWDVRGSTADDPSLDLDNVYGFGPENTSVDSPVPTAQTYSVGVHFFYGAARSTATVRIYCGARLVGTYTRALNGGAALGASNDFWRVARVTFSDASSCAVTPIDDVITFTAARTGSP